MHRKYVFAKKVYISILTTAVIMITMVATTFAWVGVLSNSSFEEFSINIRSSELHEYSIEISPTGEEGTFSDSISFADIEKQILLNCGYTQEQIAKQEDADNLFSLLNLDQCTTLPNVVNGKIQSFGKFTNYLTKLETNQLFKFDIYVSVRATYATASSDFKLDAYLDDGLLQGHTRTHELINAFTYSNEFVNPLSDIYDGTGSIVPVVKNTVIREAKVDSSSSARMGFEKYEVVDKGHPEQYENKSPKSAVIYETDLDYPYYDEDDGTYSFGGILPDDDNLAIGYYNSTEWQFVARGIKTVSMPDNVWNTRGVESSTKDLILSSETNHLIDSSNSNEQIGVNQMMKITCYFWFEGWDADCMPVLNASPVDINISLSMTNDEEF